ncbi:MAG: sugar ABC transporter substrate-binding protein [FCB group bacterium]|nr:sugar ABC transporter substrate-binding protein [FCB group bacterium]
MKTIKAARWACVAILLAAMAGCGQQQPAQSGGEGATPAADSGKPKIALIMKSLANEFFLTMENGARDHQKQHPNDYELITSGIKDETDVDRQVKLVEQMVAQGVDAIVIAPADSKALVPVCKKAIEKGITVVNIDNKFDADVLKEMNVPIPFVGPDNRKGAKLAADYLAKQLKPGDPVAIVEGVPTAFNGVQRKLGFEDAIKEAGLTLVASQVGDWEMNKASEVVSSMLISNPGLKAILCANDSMAQGAVAALRSAGKTDQVLVIGYDGITAVEDMIKEGKVLATVEQHADKLAVFGIEYALDMLKTKATPADRETPVDLVTAETLK